ncbi:MAG: TonB-dependent receptor, partial [candidate division Zixibacteria bacterium]|nr:TonB-dependent receptor [candidate division Zixibacteria bacterium]
MGSKILLLVDGERLNDTRESPFSGAQLSLVDIDEVERVEVVSGPGTVLYGTDALGGVVNVITKKASFSQSGDIKLGAAYKFRYSTTGDQKKNRIDLRASGSKWALNLGGSFRKVPNDYRTANGSSKDSSVTNSRLEEESEAGLSLGYKLTDNQTLHLDAQRNRDFGIGFAGFSPLSHPFRQRDKVSLAYEGKNLIKDIPSVRIKGYYQELTKIFQGKFGPTVVSQTNTDVKLWGVTSQNLWLIPPYQTITFGVDYNRELVRGGRLFFLAQPKTILDDNPVVPRVNWDLAGVYAQNEITPFDKLSFFLGSRFDYSRALPLETSGLDTSVQNSLPDVKTERFLSLSAGTVYRIQRGFSVNANLARAYRIPNIVERYFFGPGDLGTWVVPNYDLGREKAISLDFGFKANLDNLSGSMTYFFSEIDDFVDLRPVPDSFYQGRQVWQWKNLSGTTRILGIEAALEGSLTRGFYGFVNSSWTWAQQRRNTEEQKADSAGAFEVFFVPPFKAYLGLGWREGKNRFWAEASTRLVSQ